MFRHLQLSCCLGKHITNPAIWKTNSNTIFTNRIWSYTETSTPSTPQKKKGSIHNPRNHKLKQSPQISMWNSAILIFPPFGMSCTLLLGFPDGSVAKNLSVIAGKCRRTGFDPWVGKISRRRKQQPTLVFLPGESHGQRSLEGYSPQRHRESDRTERLSTHAGALPVSPSSSKEKTLPSISCPGLS